MVVSSKVLHGLGGGYKISAQAMQDVDTLNPKDKAKLTTFLLELRRAGDRTPLIDSDFVEKAKSADPLPVYVRAERLLRYLVKLPNHVGQRFSPYYIQKDLRTFAWSESVIIEDIMYFLHYLTTKGWLERQSDSYMITVPGYQHVAEQTTKKDLSQCFVAMWFDPSMNAAYEEGIKKAVEECGYKPLRIDQKQHLNKIDDEIIAEIRRSRFVVADFTHDAEKGVRGGVYYEAGFAYGLGLPVIYSCHKDLEKELHFDTRQYPHILWKTPKDLYAELRDKIGAIIGDYMAEPAPAMSE
ncbi:MAG: hypothetical protein OXF97_05140 [Nitrospira sp.]|nr:hypothetical protein [Nitrospira sp.]